MGLKTFTFVSDGLLVGDDLGRLPVLRGVVQLLVATNLTKNVLRNPPIRNKESIL
jgi:hypothetical protein